MTLDKVVFYTPLALRRPARSSVCLFAVLLIFNGMLYLSMHERGLWAFELPTQRP